MTRLGMRSISWRQIACRIFQELADEPFRDLLEKHGRPTDLTALRRSVQSSAVLKPDFEKRPPAPSVRRVVTPAKNGGTAKR
jgi:hypothetical protein